MFCKRGQADLIERVAAHVKMHGRFIARGESRRFFAKTSILWLDYEAAMESSIQYKPRNFDRYAGVPGYAEFGSRRDKVVTFGQVERLRCEGWWAVLSNRVHVFGDLDKMTRDLTMLMLSGDLETET